MKEAKTSYFICRFDPWNQFFIFQTKYLLNKKQVKWPDKNQMVGKRRLQTKYKRN